MPVAGDEHVRGFHVAVNDPAPMRRAKRVGDLKADIEHAFERQRRSRDHFVERGTFQQLAHEEYLSVFLARIMHGADVRVGDERRDPCFAPEPRHGLRPRHQFRAKELDGDVALETQVVRAVNLRRAVAADGVEQLVVGDADSRGHAPPLSVRQSHRVRSRSVDRTRRGRRRAAGNRHRRSAKSRTARRRPAGCRPRRPARARARAAPRWASGITGANGSTPRCWSSVSYPRSPP